MRFTDWLVRATGRLYTWALCRHAEGVGWDLGRTRTLANEYVGDVPKAIRDSLSFHAREVEAQVPRLNRRMDIGMALNEAANRAMDEKKTLREHAKDSGLTGSQLKALEFQEQYLKGIVRKA